VREQPDAKEPNVILQQDDDTRITTCTTSSTTQDTATVAASPANAGRHKELPTRTSITEMPLTAAASTASAAAAPAHGSGLTSAPQAYVASDVTSDVATSCDVQLLTELMHAGYVLGEFTEWQRQLKQYYDSPITVGTTLLALSQWRSYYLQQQLSPDCSHYKQQQYAARAPQLEHMITELERIKVACDSDTTARTSERSVLTKWSATVIRTSQLAHARLEQVRAATLCYYYIAVYKYIYI
jgi:hypothetical protein